MSLFRVKELAAAGKDGSIRPDELRELLALLPWVIEMAERAPVIPENACPDCHGEGGEFVDHCQCDAWSECPTCHGEGVVEPD